ncbi:type II secretion system F family protein [Limnoglobus roseus]|uniref:Pilus assembly protein TadB n=1 Tax=Limnoglobus roseus TaxID=2598579 RepID=A0A5C1A2C2_9BACT|nr:type II secretion system F family protein [Limnoglobus roseus]QEL13259.1 pilus assembly protein TadB [Limnoglobus roseus]
MFSVEILMAGIVLSVVVTILVVYALIAAFLPEAAPTAESESLSTRADDILPPRTFFGRTDRGFSRIVRDSYYGLTTDSAVLWMMLVGGLFATLVFIAITDPLATVAAFLIGMALTFFFLVVARDRRRRAIQEQLPDGCFQLARGLRAGLALPEALYQTSDYTPSPLGEVFRACGKSINLGLAAPAVMRRAAEDVRLTDFDQLAAVVALNSETGGDLPNLLDRLAASIRDRNQFRGYFRSVTALARISALFVALGAPVAALIYFLTYRYELFLPFVYSPLGFWMILAAVVLEVLGILWILWLLRRQDEY